MNTATLRRLLDEATPRPWVVGGIDHVQTLIQKWEES